MNQKEQDAWNEYVKLMQQVGDYEEAGKTVPTWLRNKLNKAYQEWYVLGDN